MDVIRAELDNEVLGDDDITPENDERETHLGRIGDDDDMVVFDSMKTRRIDYDESKVDNIENRIVKKGSDDNMVVNDIVTVEGDMRMNMNMNMNMNDEGADDGIALEDDFIIEDDDDGVTIFASQDAMKAKNLKQQDMIMDAIVAEITGGEGKGR